MERVAAGERRAQATLVCRLIARVRRAARALLGNPHDADDATQLCLLEVLGAAASYRGTGSIEAWSDRIVLRTAMRCVRDRTRLRRRRRELDPAAIARLMPERFGDRIPRSTVEYLEGIGVERRAALVLRHVLGHSIDEIAALTGVSRNTVKDRLVSARREFRRMVRRDLVVAPRASRRTA